MKQLKLIVCVLAAIVLGVTTTHAQKGSSAVGISLYGGPCFSNYGGFIYEGGMFLGADVNYQYAVCDYYRLRPHVSIGIFGETHHKTDKIKEKLNFLVGIDNNVYFTPVKRFRPYINLGVGVGNNSFDYDDFYNSHYYYKAKPTLVLTGGIGMDYKINDKWTFQAEIDGRFSFFSTYQTSLPILSIGVGYTIH